MGSWVGSSQAGGRQLYCRLALGYGKKLQSSTNASPTSTHMNVVLTPRIGASLESIWHTLNIRPSPVTEMEFACRTRGLKQEDNPNRQEDYQIYNGGFLEFNLSLSRPSVVYLEFVYLCSNRP